MVADPHRVSLGRLGTAEVIDRRVERGRQLTCFAHDLAPFVRRLDDQLRRTHFLADAATLERLVRDLVAMEPNGILGLATSNHDKQVKGSLGKLIRRSWARRGARRRDCPDTDARWALAHGRLRRGADILCGRGPVRERFRARGRCPPASPSRAASSVGSARAARLRPGFAGRKGWIAGQDGLADAGPEGVG